MAFCSNCGTQYNEGTRFCPRCGANATPAGYAAPPQPVPYGGYAPPPQQAPYPNYAPPPQPMPYMAGQNQAYRGGKSKSRALLLAVLFGYWTWLYTFKRDKMKFLLGLLFSISLYFIYASIPEIVYLSPLLWVWAVLTAAMRNSQWYAQY